MKTVTLKITGKHIHENVEEDQLELVTEGTLQKSEGRIYLTYDESEFTGMQGCETRLTLADGIVKMTRHGEAGLSNAVNLTDGLDGLAGGCTLVVMLAMGMVAFSIGSKDLAVFAAAIAGACVGFLWHNCYPASIFMGDTGSLALGGAFAALAVLTKSELVSLIMGGLFICEALSVIIQVVSFKATGRRVFLMAPIHHHFERLGWNETKVVIRFWIVSAAFAALGFALYFQLG